MQKWSAITEQLAIVVIMYNLNRQQRTRDRKYVTRIKFRLILKG